MILVVWCFSLAGPNRKETTADCTGRRTRTEKGNGIVMKRARHEVRSATSVSNSISSSILVQWGVKTYLYEYIPEHKDVNETMLEPILLLPRSED